MPGLSFLRGIPGFEQERSFVFSSSCRTHIPSSSCRVFCMIPRSASSACLSASWTRTSASTLQRWTRSDHALWLAGRPGGPSSESGCVIWAPGDSDLSPETADPHRVNLASPTVVNLRTRTGIQAILSTSPDASWKHPLMTQENSTLCSLQCAAGNGRGFLIVARILRRSKSREVPTRVKTGIAAPGSLQIVRSSDPR